MYLVIDDSLYYSCRGSFSCENAAMDGLLSHREKEGAGSGRIIPAYAHRWDRPCRTQVKVMTCAGISSYTVPSSVAGWAITQSLRRPIPSALVLHFRPVIVVGPDGLAWEITHDGPSVSVAGITLAPGEWHPNEGAIERAAKVQEDRAAFDRLKSRQATPRHEQTP